MRGFSEVLLWLPDHFSRAAGAVCVLNCICGMPGTIFNSCQIPECVQSDTLLSLGELSPR